MRTPLLLALLLLVGCEGDALYTFCTDSSQCGSRTYGDDDDEYTVPLECIEVEIEVEPDRFTRGNHCTISCRGFADCESEVGLGNGRCIRLAGDDEYFCYQRCESRPCYPSSSCETLTVSGEDVRVCVPTRLP